MTISLDAANALESAIDGKIRQAASPRRRASGTVSRVDRDGTVYAVLESGIETVVEGLTASVNPGDTVNVTIEDGRAEVLGNYSDPSAGVQYVRAVEGIAQKAGATAHAAVDSAKAARQVADEANKVAQATNQHFFADTNGAHITDVTQDEWAEAVDDNFSDYDPTTKPYHNQLLNSLGILLRTALNNLVSITRSAIAFYDGTGNTASNIVARFGSDGAQIGKSSAAHSVIDANGQRFYGGSNGNTQLANIGYGAGVSSTPYQKAPYFTFGTRKSGSLFGNYSVASGYDVEAIGQHSTAHGYRVNASSGVQSVFGKYNIPDTRTDTFTGDGSTRAFYFTLTPNPLLSVKIDGVEVSAARYITTPEYIQFTTAPESGAAISIVYGAGKYALIIGNGTADNARSNAFAVTWGGAADLSHTLTTQTYTKAYTAAANSLSGAITINVSKTGYTPLGIVGFVCGSSGAAMEQATINGNTATLYIRNVTTSAISRDCTINVLYTAVV